MLDSQSAAFAERVWDVASQLGSNAPKIADDIMEAAFPLTCSQARAEGANVEYAYPKEGFVVWMDNVVLLKDAPNRDNALKFINFLLDPANAAAVTNYAAYTAGVTGVEQFLDEAIKSSPENNPPADAPKGSFIQVCDQETQTFYDAIWTNLKK